MRRWNIEIFVQGPEGENLPATCFEKVTYKLHESFGKRATQGRCTVRGNWSALTEYAVLEVVKRNSRNGWCTLRARDQERSKARVTTEDGHMQVMRNIVNEMLIRFIVVMRNVPFRIEEKGWGEFEMLVTMTPVGAPKGGDTTIVHDLNFASERYDATHSVVSSVCNTSTSTVIIARPHISLILPLHFQNATRNSVTKCHRRPSETRKQSFLSASRSPVPLVRPTA